MKKRLFAFLNNSVNKRFAESDLLHRCSIGVGYANGYVAVPPEHPLHGKHYDEANNVIDIHGGLTFGEPIEEIKVAAAILRAGSWRDRMLYHKRPTKEITSQLIEHFFVRVGVTVAAVAPTTF